MITAKFFLEQPPSRVPGFWQLGLGWQLYVENSLHRFQTGFNPFQPRSKGYNRILSPRAGLFGVFRPSRFQLRPLDLHLFLHGVGNLNMGTRTFRHGARKKRDGIYHGGLGGGLVEMDGSQMVQTATNGYDLHSAGLGCTIFGANFGMGDTIPPAYLGFCFILLYFIFMLSFSFQLAGRGLREAAFSRQLLAAILGRLPFRLLLFSSFSFGPVK